MRSQEQGVDRQQLYPPRQGISAQQCVARHVIVMQTSLSLPSDTCLAVVIQTLH